ncbi:MAG TPA: penicillin-binding protein 2 [Vicinamibacterales bacterium]|jgi:penicillin-binding protein 2
MALHEDRRRIAIRLSVLQGIITVLFSVLGVSFWALQVVQHAKFEEMAENNHQRTLALRAPRGIVFDRNGQVLVENRHSYSISIVREHTKDLNRTIQLLATVLGLPENGVREIVDRHRREPTYRPITVVQDASQGQVAAVMARRLELPDVVVEEVPTRQYPNSMAAHLFGYVGEVSEEQVAAAEDLKSGDIVGQAGIEKVYNATLMGEDGAKRVVVNSVGREIRTLEEEPPTEGKRLQLTIDYDVQKAIEDAFQSAEDADLSNAGAALALDPHTGDVLGFMSRPAYDPNAFASGIDRQTWAALNTDAQRPLQNRAIQGRYPPGSTFKMAIAAAALEEGIVSPDFKVFCPGHANFYGREFHCWMNNRGGHGSVDMRRAIKESCDVYFYTVANMLDIDKINKWATALGLGVLTGIDLPNEAKGLVPSREWKQERFHEKWYAGETVSVAIGQGAVAVTPASLAVYVAALANGGTRVTPHLLKAVDEGGGWKPVPVAPPKATVGLDPEKLDAIRDGMWQVVNEPHGTGVTAAVAGHNVMGKTGSAQVVSLDKHAAVSHLKLRELRDHGWFVFAAPRENPTIAGVVFLEHGIHGGNAARLAHHILDTYFAKLEGRPLPPAPTAEQMRFDFSGSDR